MPLEFANNKMWRHGPDYLLKFEDKWPLNKFDLSPLPTSEAKITLKQTTIESNFLLNKCSTLNKLTRVIAYISRFTNNTRDKNKDSRTLGYLTTKEYQNACNIIIKLVQREKYGKELKSLQKNQSVDTLSELKTLNPYLVVNGIIRVGGRLENALTLGQKNGIILPKHHVTTLIISEVHMKYFHCGTNATLNAVRYRYWPISGRAQVKAVPRQCVRCARAKPRNNNYIMGSLPAPRVQPSSPFIHTGVDFCGPFVLKERKFRNKNTIKVYVSIFVCFATKACHLEVVDNLTSEAFIAALERFFA